MPYRNRLLLSPLVVLLFSVPSVATTELDKNRDNYNSLALMVLDWTNFFEAYPNFVEQSEAALQFRAWVNAYRMEEAKRQPRPVRGLASERVHPGHGGSAYYQEQGGSIPLNQPPSDPAEVICRQNENCTPEARFQSSRESRFRDYHERNFNNQSQDPEPVNPFGGAVAMDSTGETVYPQDLAKGIYRYHGDVTVDCTHGTCLELGPRHIFPIIDTQTDPGAAGWVGETVRFDSSGEPIEEVSQPADNRYVSNSSSRPGSSGATSGSSNGTVSASSVPPAGMAQSFRQCEANYQRALDLCGSSATKPNPDSIKNELNLRNGIQLANYLAQARLASRQQGRSMYEICEATEKMARSMTVLNSAYTGICFAAQQSCTSSCARANDYEQRLDTRDDEYDAALSSLSPGFDPGSYLNICQNEMAGHAAQGLFQSAQTAQMMAQAKSCKNQIAAGGPCATPDMWKSQACADHCQDPENSYHPACARYTAMNANCSNPQFASQNSFCLCVNHP